MPKYIFSPRTLAIKLEMAILESFRQENTPKSFRAKLCPVNGHTNSTLDSSYYLPTLASQS